MRVCVCVCSFERLCACVCVCVGGYTMNHASFQFSKDSRWP